MTSLDNSYEEALYSVLDTLNGYKFAVAGGTNLYLQDVTEEEPTDIDVLTTEEGIEHFLDERDTWYLGGNSGLLDPNRPSSPVKVEGEYKVGRFNTEGTSSGPILGDNRGIDIDVFGSISVMEEDEEFQPVEEGELCFETVDYDGHEIPVLALSSELEIHEKLGKKDRTQEIEEHLGRKQRNSQPTHLDHLDYLRLGRHGKSYVIEKEGNITDPKEKRGLASRAAKLIQ
jgi:hypothetical protein